MNGLTFQFQDETLPKIARQFTRNLLRDFGGGKNTTEIFRHVLPVTEMIK